MKNIWNKLSRKQIVFGITGMISFLIVCVLIGYSSNLIRKQISQRMASRWSEEGKVSQISCFLSTKAQFDEDSIKMFEYNLDNALLEASIVNESPNVNSRLWTDAYSADGTITLKSDKGSITADALGIGGDFFLFHPLQLITGSFFSGNDLMQDYCVIDEDAAWQLFGSNDVAGQLVTVGEIPLMITGVIKRESGKFQDAAGLNKTLVYVSYDTLTKYGMSNGINHYEIVMPNPVSKYAYNYVKEHIGVMESEIEIVENTTRFQLLERVKMLASFGTRSMNGKAIIYPYWENVARGYEDILAFISLFILLFSLYPVILIIVQLVILWKRKTWTFKSVFIATQDKIEIRMRRSKNERKKQ